MPFKQYPQLAKMISALTEPTCVVCLLQVPGMSDQAALIEVFEQTALQATLLAHGLCYVCHKYKTVITPA
jgi:hypothetical protein